jgi:hypothetical protein
LAGAARRGRTTRMRRSDAECWMLAWLSPRGGDPGWGPRDREASVTRRDSRIAHGSRVLLGVNPRRA